jgi:hypothetical protein
LLWFFFRSSVCVFAEIVNSAGEVMGERRGGGVVVNFWDFVELVEFGPPSMKQLKPSRPPSKNQRFYCLSLLCISQPAGPAKPVRSHINIIIIPSMYSLHPTYPIYYLLTIYYLHHKPRNLVPALFSLLARPASWWVGRIVRFSRLYYFDFRRSVTANIGWYVISILHDRPPCNIDITWP